MSIVFEPASHAKNPSRMRLQAFIARAGRELPAGSTMLDAGAGDCRYRALFPQVHYESADFCQVDKPYAAVDYVCNLDSIPVQDRRYDLVLLTQVLEHLPEPQAVLKELWRVLKPGGTLWLTTPLYYQEHEAPHDYYRYTQFGLRHQLATAQFEVREIDWLEGYYGTFSYQLTLASTELVGRRADIGLTNSMFLQVIKKSAGFAARFLASLEHSYKLTDHGHCKNYAIVARKPLASAQDAPANADPK